MHQQQPPSSELWVENPAYYAPHHCSKGEDPFCANFAGTSKKSFSSMPASPSAVRKKYKIQVEEAARNSESVDQETAKLVQKLKQRRSGFFFGKD